MTEFEEDNIHFTAELRVNYESEGEVKVFSVHNTLIMPGGKLACRHNPLYYA